MSEKREPWIDAARGLLIVLVVLGHAFGTAYHLASDRGAAHVSQMIYKSIYMFHMPAFFVLAGVTWSAGQCGFLRYIRKKALRLLIPYFAFGLMSIALYFVCQVLGAGLGASSNGYYGAGACNSLVSELLRLVRGDACSLNSPLWFLPCMFIVELLYYWVNKFLPIGRVAYHAPILMLMLLVSWMLIGVRVLVLPEWWTRVPVFLAMMHVGRLGVGKQGLDVIEMGGPSARLAVCLFAVIYFSVCWCLPWEALFHGVLPYFGYRIWALMGAFVVFFVAQTFSARTICRVGVASLGVLVLHKFPLAIVQLKTPLFFQGSELVTISLTFLLGIMVVVVCVFVSSKIETFLPIAFGKSDRRNP